MPIVKPFMGSRKFTAIIGDGTGATFAIPATNFIDDTGTAATVFPGSFAYYVLSLNALVQNVSYTILFYSNLNNKMNIISNLYKIETIIFRRRE